MGDLEIFGENIYAIHSIKYLEIEHHFYVFAVRCLDQWLSWEEVKFYAALLDFPTVPELGIQKPTDQEKVEKSVLVFSSISDSSRKTEKPSKKNHSDQF